MSMGGTVRAVQNRRRRALTTLVPLLLVISASASAQQSGGGDAIGAAPSSPVQSPTTPDATTPSATTPLPTTPATQPVPTPTPEAAAAPTPPPYLTAGAGAQRLPTVATVGDLTEPVVPIAPIRLAGIACALACLLLLAYAGLMRSLGLRTAARSPAAATAPQGRVARLGDRARLVADDVRDFLARRR